MRRLGLGLLGVALAVGCGSTSRRQRTSATGGSAGAAPTGGSATTAGAAAGAAGTATTGGSQDSPPQTQPSGGVPSDGGTSGGEGGALSDAGAGGGGGDPDLGKTLISGVVMSDDELPVANAVVQAQGRRVTTAGDGSFQLLVTLPYDLVVFEPALKPEAQPAIGEPHAYLGLTRTELKLYIRTFADRSTSVSGTITGRLATPDPQVGLIYGRTWQYLNDGGVSANGRFSFTAPFWHGDQSLPAILVVAQSDPPPSVDAPPHLNSLAIKSIMLDPTKNVGSPATDVVLSKPTFHSMTFNLAPPPGKGFSDCDVDVELGGAFQLFFQYGCAPVSRQLDVPDGVPEGVIYVYAHGFSEKQNWEYEVKAVVPSNAESFSVSVPQSLPVIKVPGEQAVLKASTDALVYTPIPDALADLKLCFADRKAKREACADIYTEESVVPLSRILNLGMGAAASGGMSLDVQAVPGVHTTSELVAPTYVKADQRTYRDYNGGVRTFSYTAE
jgi:hypothetical protein